MVRPRPAHCEHEAAGFENTQGFGCPFSVKLLEWGAARVAVKPF